MADVFVDPIGGGILVANYLSGDDRTSRRRYPLICVVHQTTYTLVKTHFPAELKALGELIDRVLDDPRRKFLRAALHLPRASTQLVYDARLLKAMISMFRYGTNEEVDDARACAAAE